MNACFVCLENCKNRVCVTCKCYAHPKCWGKFISTFDNVITYVSSTIILTLITYGIPCPQCKRHIYNTKPITREDTKFSRQINVEIIYQDFLLKLNNIENIYNKQEQFKKLFKFLLKHKLLIRNNKQISDIIKSKLKNIYNIWPSSNLYYYQIFGEQLL